jgi:hypothetical protein
LRLDTVDRLVGLFDEGIQFGAGQEQFTVGMELRFSVRMDCETGRQAGT